MRSSAGSRLGVLGAFVLFHAYSAAAVGAQEVRSALTGATVQTYRLSETVGVHLREVSLLSTPFGVTATLSPWASLDVASAFASGSITLSDGSEVDVDGITDTRLHLRLRTGNFHVSGVAIVASGEATLTPEVVAVVGLLSSDLFPFAITHWGGGGRVGGEAGVNFRLGRSLVDVTAGYVASNGFVPLVDQTAVYLPGDERRLRAVVETQIGDASSLSLMFGVQDFLTDVIEDVNIFRPGRRMDAQISYTFPVGARESVLLYGGMTRRESGVFPRLSASLAPEAGLSLAGLSESPTRQLVRVGGEASVVRRTVTVTPEIEVRLLRNEDGVGQGWLGSFGASAEYRILGGRFGQRLLIAPAGALRFGSALIGETLDATVTGWQAGVSLRFVGGQW